MSCIACDSVSEFRCTIKGLSVCLCSKHMEKEEVYDSIVPETASN